MIVSFTKQADADIDFFNRSGNKQVIKKIKELLQSIVNNPYKGIGQPEQLKHDLSGAWSRRINKEHRLVYEVKDEVVYVLSLKGHY
ncbi:Txe/YoeB family addiction module toxin [Mucilaginibacter terrigena]|uniref:Putative mRNA interferase YoeB n=1 Tax=Mucilaginibacter terrigena TaxID=2492395 RepID=A0A4Q5LMV9_9SPHI|nr:Txe/YoeB family addiction module toxin [Mucilaginibacter terrigena]RYU90435.1 Txe/YoeB family addiction module toxin [Mucilaginibacter terrigena]